MGEWEDVIVDELLPLRKRSECSNSHEWWVPLTEKAYAKYVGSYDQIVGGCPCWALTDLTGGIAIQQKQDNFHFISGYSGQVDSPKNTL